jgi:DNA-binding transcriptional ArsR family regulator
MRTLVGLFKALSDETRLRIINLLLGGELCVCELMDALQMPQPRISHQLRILKGAGLVMDRREGRWIIYALEAMEKDDPASPVLKILQDRITGGVFERDRARLLETFAKGLRTSCTNGPHPPEGRNQDNNVPPAQHGR